MDDINLRLWMVANYDKLKYNMRKLKQSDYTKIKQFFNRNISNNQMDNIPIVNKINEHEMYIGPYHILKDDMVWIVEYDESINLFGTKKNAMYFAFLDFYKRSQEIKNLKELDYRATNYKTNIDRYHLLIQRTTNFWKYQLFCNKLSEEESRYSKVQSDLKNWFKMTKYIKLGI